MKKEEGGKSRLTVLLTDSPKRLSNLLTHSSFFFYWYSRSNSFPRKEKVSSENSAKLNGSWCTCYWKPQNFPWEMHRLVPSSVGPLGHPRVFLLMPGHWEVMSYSSGYKFISFRIVLSRSTRGQDPAMGGTACMLHPKICIFCSQMKGMEGKRSAGSWAGEQMCTRACGSWMGQRRAHSPHLFWDIKLTFKEFLVCLMQPRRVRSQTPVSLAVVISLGRQCFSFTLEILK